MPLPSSGTISMSQINTELGRSSTAQISLDTAENGGYAAINNCSTYKPSSTNPASISEWYRYNHAQTCTLCNTDVTVTNTTTGSGFMWQATHVLYFNITNLGDIQPVLAIDSTTQNIYFQVFLEDAATGQYIGDESYNASGASTFTGSRVGVQSTGLVKATVILYNTTTSSATVTWRLKLNCPTTLGCNTSMTTVIPYCGCGGSRIYHWVDLGTTSRTVNVTYSTPGTGGGTQTIEVNYAGTNLTITGSTGYGSNLTFSFPYTYNGSTSLARIAWINDCWC